MIRHHLQRHKYKVVVGVPVAILVASSLSFVRDDQEMCIVPEDNRYVQVGEIVTLHVIAQADEPVNVIGGTIKIPSDYVTLESISKEGSIIDLWSEEPNIEDAGRVHFSGGIVSPSGFLGNGRVLTLVVKPTQVGEATVVFEEVRMLAHDGTGADVACGNNPITLAIRAANYPSPDVNGDKVVNIFDFGIVSSRLFFAYNNEYDLDQDGKISLSDVSIIVSNMGGGSGIQGSLALLWSK